MTQLNSLSYSLNSAHNKMLDRELNVNFARSSTGDGFYIWNRDLGVKANTNLYHLMHLVLADNAIARSKAHGRTVPLLRAAAAMAGAAAVLVAGRRLGPPPELRADDFVFTHETNGPKDITPGRPLTLPPYRADYDMLATIELHEERPINPPPSLE